MTPIRIAERANMHTSSIGRNKAIRMPILLPGTSRGCNVLRDKRLPVAVAAAHTPRTLQWTGAGTRFGRPTCISVMKSIRILVTGGTFDKQYDELTGRLFFRDTHLPEMLRLGRCRLDVTIETVMMIDSLELDDAGRARIVDRARSSEERAIVVTHGTDTMVR